MPHEALGNRRWFPVAATVCLFRDTDAHAAAARILEKKPLGVCVIGAAH